MGDFRRHYCCARSHMPNHWQTLEWSRIAMGKIRRKRRWCHSQNQNICYFDRLMNCTGPSTDTFFSGLAPRLRSLKLNHTPFPASPEPLLSAVNCQWPRQTLLPGYHSALSVYFTRDDGPLPSYMTWLGNTSLCILIFSISERILPGPRSPD